MILGFSGLGVRGLGFRGLGFRAAGSDFRGVRGHGCGWDAGWVTERSPAPIPSDFNNPRLHTLQPVLTTIIAGGFRNREVPSWGSV